MSRRHHGRAHHARHRPDISRPLGGPEQRPSADAGSTTRSTGPVPEAPRVPEPVPEPARSTALAQAAPVAAPPASNQHEPPPTDRQVPDPSQRASNGNGQPTNGHAPVNGHAANVNGHAPESQGCTAPQLRRFIKSRPYVPMHELRRRFAIDVDDDEVSQVALDGTRIYVGLPDREGALLGELLKGGEIGYELSLDPLSPVVVGVYPMRPVPRA